MHHSPTRTVGDDHWRDVLTPYIVKRLAFSAVVLFAISIIVFVSVRAVPGDVCAIVFGDQPDPAACDAVNKELGLDKPVVTQYLVWVGGIMRGDFGKTLLGKRDVWGEIQNRIPLTLELTILATAFALVIALPVGVYSAVRQDRAADYLLRIMTIGWLSIPNFWLGTMLIVFPARWWGYSPPVGYVDIWVDPLKNLEQLYLPAISLGLALSASLARLARSSMLEVLRMDYVRTARAKGLVERAVVMRHALKNALIPLVTLFALQFGVLFGGTVILESIYSLPGLGFLTLNAVRVKDYPQVQALVLLFAVVLVSINLLVDISYAFLDPRIRYA